MSGLIPVPQVLLCLASFLYLRYYCVWPHSCTSGTILCLASFLYLRYYCVWPHSCTSGTTVSGLIPVTHTTQHTVTTTHSPSQLHLLYTQNSLNTHHKLLVHIPQLFPYSASSINATAWSHSTPQTLTSTSKQVLHYNKHLHHSCWYLKGTVYKAMASCENCETISGVYKSAMAQVTCTMEYGICTLGKTYCCPRVQIPYN